MLFQGKTNNIGDEGRGKNKAKESGNRKYRNGGIREWGNRRIGGIREIREIRGMRE